MRNDANQREIALDAPLNVVIGVKSEADAVRKCLRIALLKFGRDQQTVALMTGWKKSTCLCEAAKDSSKRRIPDAKLHRFAVATGCNLVSQYRERIQAEARNKGLTIQRDEADRAAHDCMAAWQVQTWAPVMGERRAAA